MLEEHIFESTHQYHNTKSCFGQSESGPSQHSLLWLPHTFQSSLSFTILSQSLLTIFWKISPHRSYTFYSSLCQFFPSSQLISISSFKRGLFCCSFFPFLPVKEIFNTYSQCFLCIACHLVLTLESLWLTLKTTYTHVMI